MPAEILSNKNGLSKSENNNYPGKSVTETITNGFFTVDRNWTVKYWNKAAEKLLGVSTKDMVGKNLWEKFAGVIPLEFYANYSKAFIQDIPLHFEEYWGEMGTWFDVITYYNNNILYVSFKSSNHRSQPVQQLKILTELYRFVTEITNDCLWEWDLIAGEIFWIDGGHKRVFGYRVENALVPQSFWESCLHPEDKDRVLKNLVKTLEEGSVSLWEEEYRFKKADGTYAHVCDRGHIFYDDQHKACKMIGATKDITEKVILEKELMQERINTQKEITHAVLEAQEKERADIGKELHDNLNQILGTAKMYIGMAQKDEENSKICLDIASDYIMKVIAEIRSISKKLVIPGIDILSLTENIENLIDEIMSVNPLKIEFHENHIDEAKMNEKLQLNIYRMVQEQLNNILKHAEATRACVDLSCHNNEIILLITDDGKGCDISKAQNGVGLINIRSRTQLYDGVVTITSKPAMGYELKVVLPLNVCR